MSKIKKKYLDFLVYEKSEVDTLVTTSSGDIVAQIPTTLLELTDTPSGYNNDKYLKSTTSGIEWSTVSGAGVSDHGALTGLADDDHTQYLLVDGTRQLSGTWNYGAQTISGTGDIYTLGSVGVGTTAPEAAVTIVAGNNPGSGWWDSGWSNQRQITVVTASGNAVDVGYSVRYLCTGSDAAGIYNNSLVNGDDLRIVYLDGVNWVELDRDLVTFSDTEIEVWFSLQASIAGAESDSNHYVYYTNVNAGSPPVDFDNVYIWGDNLEQDTVGNDPSKWTISQGTNSTLKVSEDVGYLTSAESLGLNISAVWIAPDGAVWAGHFSDGTVRKSTDDGETWTTKYTCSGTGLIRNIWVASNGYIFVSRDDSGILIRSTDNGDSWSTCLSLSSATYSVVWVMDEDSAGNLYAGEYSSGSVEAAYIYKSTNNGDDWATIWNNPDSARHIHFVRVDPYTDYIYASQGDEADGKLIRSTNGGTDWTVLGFGSSLWQPTSMAFGDGFRLVGYDNIDSPPVCIKKTTDDSNFTTVYTPPAGDNVVFWGWGRQDSNGAFFFGSWTQTSSIRATIVGTWDDGTTWKVLEGIYPSGNGGFLSGSEFDSEGRLYCSNSVAVDGQKRIFRQYTDKNIKAVSADTTQATAYKTLALSGSFIVEHRAMASQTDSILTPLFIRDGATDRISVAFWSDGLIKYHNSTDWISTGKEYVADFFYEFRYVVHLDSGDWDLHIDNLGYSQTAIPFRNAGTTADRLWFGSGANNQGNNYWDDFRVRSYVATEPTISGGAETNKPQAWGLITKDSLGTLGLVVRDDGNVGVGVMNPNCKLEVDGTVSGTYFYGDGSNLTGISGVTDHGMLIGLSDDDHIQYVLTNASRGFTSTVSGVDPSQNHHLSTKYYVDTQVASASGTTDHNQLTNLDYASSGHTGFVSDADLTTISGDLQTQIDGKADMSHSHTASDITDFNEAAQDAVGNVMSGAGSVVVSYDDAANTITISGTTASGGEAPSDHSQLINLDYASSGHTGFAPTSHSHTESDITDLGDYALSSELTTASGDLQDQIDDKSNTGHTHTESDITDLDHDAIKLQGRTIASTVPNDGESLVWDDGSSEWEPVMISGGGGGSATPYIKVSDRKNAGTNGGTFNSGSWLTRDLNTEDQDTGEHCSLSSNQITLDAGTYDCQISAPVYKVDTHRIKLENVTDTATILLGTSEYMGNTTVGGNRSFAMGRFTIGASKALEVQHRCSFNQTNDYGRGTACNFGVDEVYTIAEFWKVG